MERFQGALQFAVVGHSRSGKIQMCCIHILQLKGAQAVIVVFDLSNYNSLDHARYKWLKDAMRDNDPSSVLLFLVGTKKDLSHPISWPKWSTSAIRLFEEIRAEYWAVSALSGRETCLKDFRQQLF